MLYEVITDGVVVATPPDRHLEQTLAALEAGKHVVVEKPAWPHAADVRRVRAAAVAGTSISPMESRSMRVDTGNSFPAAVCRSPMSIATAPGES